jgi:hypothetical protein
MFRIGQDRSKRIRTQFWKAVYAAATGDTLQRTPSPQIFADQLAHFTDSDPTYRLLIPSIPPILNTMVSGILPKRPRVPTVFFSGSETKKSEFPAGSPADVVTSSRRPQKEKRSGKDNLPVWPITHSESAKTRAGPIDSVGFVRDNLLRRFDMLPHDFIQQKQVGEQCAEMNGSVQIINQLRTDDGLGQN